MRRVALIAAAAVLTGVLAGVVLAGGGDDDSSNENVKPPELTVPGGSGRLSDEGATGDDGASGETGPTGSSEPSTPPADQGTGGAVVNVMAYQADYVTAREELKVIDATARAKNCDAPRRP